MSATMSVPCRLAVALAILGVALAAPAQANTFAGRAYCAQINLLTGPVYVSDTGDLPLEGGWNGATLPSTSVPGVLTADVLVAAASAAQYEEGGAKADSSTSLAEVVVFPGQPAQLTASFVRAQSGIGPNGLLAVTEINDLVFGGVPIAVTGQPNQRVEILGVATLVINEQTMTSDASSQSVSVNALHLRLATGEEVILSSARSSITW